MSEKKTVSVTLKCMMCGKEETHEYTAEEYSAYQSGMRIQDAMPDRNVFEREFLISSTCFDCQSKLFNCPKPGEDWGPVVGECGCCGAPLYKKDNGVCPTCGEKLE